MSPYTKPLRFSTRFRIVLSCIPSPSLWKIVLHKINQPDRAAGCTCEIALRGLDVPPFSRRYPQILEIALYRPDRCAILTVPGETEAGSAGEQPAKGYPGQAHRTMRTNEPGGAPLARPAPPPPPPPKQPPPPPNTTPHKHTTTTPD